MEGGLESKNGDAAIKTDGEREKRQTDMKTVT